MVAIGEIAEYIEDWAPLSLAEPWDKVGLQIGRRDTTVERLMVALDVTDSLLDEAAASNCGLIVAHHPLIFGDFTGLNESTSSGRLALKAAEKGIGVYTAHTNLDKAPGGVSDALADKLGLLNIQVLQSADTLLKLVVFVPADALEAVKTAIGNAGGGVIGLYSHCSFSVAGTGSFRPLAGADPSVGEVGRDNSVSEYRLEAELSRARAPMVIKAMVEAHPYEEVAYDLYELRNFDRRYGLGRIGNTKSRMTLDDFAGACRDKLVGMLRVAGWATNIERAAVCGGSGAGLMGAAKAAGADVMVTGDVKYHEVQKALDLGLAIIDAGHDVTEIPGMTCLAERLAVKFDVDVEEFRFTDSIWKDGRQGNLGR